MKSEEGRRDFIEELEENPTEEDGVSNRQVSSTFIPPLTAETDTAKSERLTLSKLRAALGWSRNQLAQVMNASDHYCDLGAGLRRLSA